MFLQWESREVSIFLMQGYNVGMSLQSIKKNSRQGLSFFRNYGNLHEQKERHSFSFFLMYVSLRPTQAVSHSPNMSKEDAHG